MKVLILTGYDSNKSYQEVGPLSAQNKYEYAMKNGYSFLCYRSYESYDRPPSWFKIPLILSLMESYDWIFWSDADSIVTNFNIKVEEIIEKKYERKKTVFLSPAISPVEVNLPDLKEQNYIITQDDYSPCMGEFMIRNCEWSKKFFLEINNQTQFINDPIWENRAQDYLMFHNSKILEYCKFIPKKEMNAFYKNAKGEDLDWQQGDFVCHFPATEPERRLRYTKELIQKVIR